MTPYHVEEHFSVQMNYTEWSNTLLDSFGGYYNTRRLEPDDDFFATMVYHARDEKYILTQSAKLWAAESHEYAYMVAVDHLDLATAKEKIAAAMEQGMQCIKPHPEHMKSTVTALFVCQTCDKDAAKYIARFTKSKAYKFSMHGWMYGRAICLECGNQAVHAGSNGRDMASYIRKRIKNALKAEKESLESSDK